MTENYPYVTKLDIRFDALQLIDANEIINNCTDKWYNESLSKVNESVLRIAIVEGEYHWHKHDNDDELFFVLEGKLFVDTESQTFELNKYQGITIPKGVIHRTRAPFKTVMLMIENVGIIPTGDK